MTAQALAAAVVRGVNQGLAMRDESMNEKLEEILALVKRLHARRSARQRLRVVHGGRADSNVVALPPRAGT